jgi:hypothetical protein
MHCRWVALCRLIVGCAWGGGLLFGMNGCAGLSRQQQTFRIPNPSSPQGYPAGVIDRGVEGMGAAPLGAQPSQVPQSAEVLRIEPRSTPSRSADSGTAESPRTDAPSRGAESAIVEDSTVELPPPSRGKSPLDREPRLREPEPADDDSDKESWEGPGLTPPDVEFEALIPQGELELEASAVEQSAVGQLTTFHVLLRNTTSQPVENLKVMCELGPGLRFPGRDERELEAGVARLEPGETKEWDLSLVGERKGQACCRFVLLPPKKAASKRRPEQRVCVTFVERQFSLELLGPRQRPVGARAEYVVLVRNPGGKPLEGVTLRVSSDKAVQPTSLTEGSRRDEDGLSWDLGTLEPGESRRVQVEFTCEREAQRAVVRAEIEAEGVALEPVEQVLRIDPAIGPLVAELWDRTEPLVVGNRGRLEFSVKNTGLNTARRLAVGVKLPRELGLITARLERNGVELSTNFSVRDERLEFDLVDELEPDQVLTGVIEVEALEPGRVESWLEARSSVNRQPATSGEWTLVEPR